VNHDAVQRDLVIVDENRSVGSRTRRIIGSENLLKRRRNAREPNRRGVRVKKNFFFAGSPGSRRRLRWVNG